MLEISELKEGQTGFAIFDETPFYAEGGGQSADVGFGINESKKLSKFNVLDVQKYSDVFVHTIEAINGSFKVADQIHLSVDKMNRSLTASNHSATHLLHFALRQELGTHVKQAGSLVNSEKLRFDFTNKGPLSEEQVNKIELTVNSIIQKSIDVKFENKSYKDAVKDGALALFGEKYEDEVRVISMGESIELCGGTHVTNVAQIKYFKIISESGVSSGVRRIEALTDYNAITFLNQQFEDFKIIKNLVQLPNQASREQVSQQIFKFKNEISELKKEIKSKASNSFSIESAIESSLKLNIKSVEISYLICETDISDPATLRETADRLKDKLQNGIVVIIGPPSEKTPLLVSISKNLANQVQAGQILKQITNTLGGSGGGRPDMAQGAISNPNNFKIEASKNC